jgi:chromosome segregation ATPase
MIVRTLILLSILSLIPIPACAEYYKYKDTNGVFRFTDNLLDVPKDQRENIQTYKEAVTPEPKPETSNMIKEEATLKGKNSRIEQLNSERESLEQSYRDLEAERNFLLESSPSPQEKEAYETHKKRINAFNEKIKSYEEQRKMFQSKVDAFNAENENP